MARTIKEEEEEIDWRISGENNEWRITMPMEYFYEYILEEITTKKTFNSIKKKYEELDIDFLECEIVDNYTDDEKKQIENIDGWKSYIKFKFYEDDVINKFDYFTTYNTSSPFAMALCVMDLID